MSTGTQTEVVMPQMGVSVSEGTITKWLKQVGDAIGRDEPLLEISTDKVDTEVPSPAEGVVTQILVQEGETVEVGTVLAIIAPAGAGSRPGRRLPPPELRRPRPSPAVARRSAPRRRAREPAPVAAAAPARSRRRAGRARRPPSATARPSSRRSSRASPPSTASTRRPSRAPGPAAA